MATAVHQSTDHPRTPQRRSESMSTLATPTSSSSASRPSPLRSSSPPATPASNPRTTTTTTTSQSSIPQMSRSASSVAITQKVPITVESALAAADGDPLAALEAVVAQRNKLLEENDGLWKMVQNVRDKADTYRADAARYRNERDRALSSTRSTRGASPAPSGMSGSASAIGLGLAEASSAGPSGSRPPRSFSGGPSTLLAYPGVGKRQMSEDNSRSSSTLSTPRKDGIHPNGTAGAGAEAQHERGAHSPVTSPTAASDTAVRQPDTPASDSARPSDGSNGSTFKAAHAEHPSPSSSSQPLADPSRAPATFPIPSSSTFSPTAPLRVANRGPPSSDAPTPPTTSISAPSTPPAPSSSSAFPSHQQFAFPTSAASPRPTPASGSASLEPKLSRRQQVAESTLEFPPEISHYLASLGESPKSAPKTLPDETARVSPAPSAAISSSADSGATAPASIPAYVMSVSSPDPPTSQAESVSSTAKSPVPGLSSTSSPSASSTSTLPQLAPVSPFFNDSPNATPGGSRSGAVVDLAGREEDDDDPEPRAPSKTGMELQKQQRLALKAATEAEAAARARDSAKPVIEDEEPRTPNPARQVVADAVSSTSPPYSPSASQPSTREDDPRARQQYQQYQHQQQQQYYQQPQQPGPPAPYYHQQQQQQYQLQQGYGSQPPQQPPQQQHPAGGPSSRPYPPSLQQPFQMYQPSQPPRSPVHAAFGAGSAPSLNQPSPYPSAPRGASTDNLPSSPPPPQETPSTPRSMSSQQQQQQQQQRLPPPQQQRPPPPQQSQPPPAVSLSPRGPLLQSAALPFTTLSIHSCTVVVNDAGKEVIRFRVAVTLTPPPSPSRPIPSSSWKVDKLFSDFLALDGSVRGKIGRKEAKARGIVSLPEAKAWKDVAVGKLDQRKKLLETYLQSILDAQLPEKDDFCWFLSTGVVPNEIAAQQVITKEGMLLKRGQKFGGWKKRFFALGGLGRPVMDYFDSKGGAHIGSIALVGAQIGRSKEPLDGGDPHQRHAFLIIEGMSNGGRGTRHVLCADSDEERDEWVDILVLYTTGKFTRAASPASRGNNSPTPPPLPRSSTSSSIQSNSTFSGPTRKPSLRKLSKDDIVIGAAQPISSLPQDGTSPKFEPVLSSPIEGTPKTTFGALDSARNDHLRRQHNPKAGSASTLTDMASSGSLPNLEQASRSGGPRHVPSNAEMGQYADSDERPPAHPSPVQASARMSVQTHRQSAMPPSRFNPNSGRGGGGPAPSNLSLSTIPAFSSAQSQASSPSQASPAEDRNGAISPDKVPDQQRIQASKISGPQGGAPIPAGFKFGAKDEVPERDRKAKSGRWGFPGFGKMTGSSSANPLPQSRPVFGVPLTESLSVSKIAELPAVVYRCIEYLEAKHAELEEGIYRLSGSSAVIKGLRDRFNTEGDVDLLREGETWDPHAICGVLKGFLRELTTSLLTRELHMSFLKVIDFVESEERVRELRHLVGELPLPNYSLLRALTAHLILIVENATTNKMTLRNVGIVFSPTLGIPAGVFSELVLHFQSVFDDVSVDNADETASQKDAAVEHQSKRNSFLGTETMLGLGGRKLSVMSPDSNVDEEGSIDDSATDDEEHDGQRNMTSPEAMRDPEETIRMTPPPTNLAIPPEFTGNAVELTYNRQPISAGLPLSPRPAGSASPLHSPSS